MDTYTKRIRNARRTRRKVLAEYYRTPRGSERWQRLREKLRRYRERIELLSIEREVKRG